MKVLTTLIYDLGQGLQTHEAFRGRKVRFQVTVLLLLSFIFCLLFACLFTLYVTK